MVWNKRQAPANLPSGFHSGAVPSVAPQQGLDPNTAVSYYAYSQQLRRRGRSPQVNSPNCTTNPQASGAHQTSQTPAQSSRKRDDTRQKKSGFQTVTVHAPGCPPQNFRICVGNDPEDIAAWIKERKRRFPRQKKLNDLLGVYSSSDEEDDDGPKNSDSVRALQTRKDPPVQKDQQTDHSNKISAVLLTQPVPDTFPKRLRDANVSQQANDKRRRLCRYFSAKGTCNNGDKCSFVHENNGNNNKTSAAFAPSRLLDKLLEKERKREAALTLQLLYVLHNEFNCFQDYDDDDIAHGEIG